LAELFFSENNIKNIVNNYEDYAKKKLASKNTELRGLEKTLKNLDKQISNLVDAISKNALPSLIDKLDEFEQEKATLRTKIDQEKLIMENNIVNKDAIKSTVEHAKQKLIDGSLESIQYFINLLVNRVIIYKEHVEVYFNVLPLLLNYVKSSKLKSYFCVAKVGGGEGSRTPVRKQKHLSISECSPYFRIPSLRRLRTGF